jgi:hypothetical protein
MNTDKDLPSLPSEASEPLGSQLAKDSEHFGYLNAKSQAGSQQSGDQVSAEEPQDGGEQTADGEPILRQAGGLGKNTC